MLDLDTRHAILRLSREGHGIKAIARWLGVSRNSVRRVLESGQAEVPPLQRAEQLATHVERIETLYAACEGNLVRVHEELAAAGEDVAYSTLTAFCRRYGIGVKEKKRPGRYHFMPGEEMQHDTSPHTVVIGGRKTSVQCASLVLCFSRRQYAQVYPRWSRFEARVFLSGAVVWIGGAATRCMIDNSSVVIASGTGADAKAAPEMKALADRFAFAFVAHAVGDANRSARVERPFHHIEHNFYPGRTFADLADLNRQLADWCQRNFLRRRRSLQASPAELFATESAQLRPVPPYVPEVYELHRRRVDIEGYVNLHTNRYSVDAALIGHHLQVREGIETLRVFEGHRLVAQHIKYPYGAHHRETLDEHRGQTRRRRGPAPPSPEEALLRAEGPAVVALVDALRKRHGGRAQKAVRRLHRLWLEYPADAVAKAIEDALRFGLTDLHRLERMILRRVAGDFFQLPLDPGSPKKCTPKEQPKEHDDDQDPEAS
jgi:hypothetical protein